MAKKLTLKGLAARLVAEAGLEPTEWLGVDALFVTGELRHTLSFGRDKHNAGLFGWSVRADDEQFLDTVRMGVEIWRPDRPVPGSIPRSAGYRYPWPDTDADLGEALVDLGKYGHGSVSFVRDLPDLGQILLSQEDVRRGEVWVPASSGSQAARLVKAVLLSRRLGDESLEEQAMDLLRRRAEEDVTWVPGQPYLFRQAVADWAQRFEKACGVDLSHLVRLRRRGFQ